MELDKIKDKSIFNVFSGDYFDKNGTQCNIMDFKDEIIYVWDEGLGCLLTQGVRPECVCHQELRPTKQPDFKVNYVSVNGNGTRAALWGPGGVAIIELPQRFGSFLEFENGKKNIVVKCLNVEGLDVDFGTSVLQLRWDTSALLSASLTILLSNNTLCNVFVKPKECSPARSLRLGCQPSSRIHTLAALGETAIDFCFVYNMEDSSSNGCPLLVLKGNGDVMYVDGGDDFPEGQTLPMSPLPDDNYLADACSILAIPGKPPGVIIATSRGIVYHTILVPLDIDQISVPLRYRKYRLLVIESILLELGLQTSSDDLSSFPVQLLADIGHSRRYLAIHNAGVHSIVMEVLSGVSRIIKGKGGSQSGDNVELQNHATITDTHWKVPESMVEYIVCSSRPLHGCVVFPYKFIAIDAEKRVIELSLRRIELVPFELFTPQKTDITRREGPLTVEMRKPFEQKIGQLLNDSRVLPHWQLPAEELPREEMLALVVRIGNLVRKETIPRYRQIRSILSQRVQLIGSLKELLLQEISAIEIERAEVQLAAETFSERVQTIVEDLEGQRERVQAIARKVASVRPVLSDAEVRMNQTIGSVESKVTGYSDTLEKLKKTWAYQDMKICESSADRQVALSNKQATIIHHCLSEIGDAISKQVKKVNELNSMLGLCAD